MTPLYEPQNAAFEACRSLLRREPLWEKLLAQTGLHVDSRSADRFLKSVTERIPRVNRDVKGFEDFAQAGCRGIEPGQPAYSLLYHALASPGVVDFENKPLRSFPTEDEMENIEDLVYALDCPTLETLEERARGSQLACVVFAYEYRIRPETVHRTHADLCFSRTGVARIGNADPQYLAHARGYLPSVGPNETAADRSLKHDEHTTIRVVPSRFGLFVAALRKGDPSSFGPMRFQKDPPKVRSKRSRHKTEDETDSERSFWVPLHKLFNGRDCLQGMDLSINWHFLHTNEKIKRVHLFLRSKGFETGWAEPDIEQPPFKFQKEIANLYPLSSAGGTVKIVPCTHNPLLEKAEFRGEPLGFDVQLDNRTYFTSLWLEPNDDSNFNAPEFVYFRERMNKDGSDEDLTKLKDFVGVLKSGGFKARHYRDFTGDGFVQAACPQLADQIPAGPPAYSLVAVSDFFPLVSQRQLQDWYDITLPATVKQILWSGDVTTSPQPLSDVRLPPNLKIAEAGFTADDVTVTAVISPLYEGMSVGPPDFDAKTVRQTHLPDHAAGVMSPGWDTSRDLMDKVPHLAAYGLGSPFPEDLKLCAAETAFWPAATPDTTRFYPQWAYRTTTPMPDRYEGWDEVPLPKRVHGKPDLYKYSALAYVDYVKTAYLNRFQMRKVADVKFAEFAEWTIVMANVHLAFNANTGESAAKWYVPEFELAAANDRDLRAAEEESGHKLEERHTYRLVVFRGRLLNSRAALPKELVKVHEEHTVYADRQSVLRRNNSGGWYKAY
jgi:hypothetical protein